MTELQKENSSKKDEEKGQQNHWLLSGIEESEQKKMSDKSRSWKGSNERGEEGRSSPKR
jgi:hypothetical protein